MKNSLKLLAAAALACFLVASCNKDNTATLELPTFNNGLSLVDGYVAVDLGLTVKWASCNVGAYAEEGRGLYFAWGETMEKSNYDWVNEGDYKWGINEGNANPTTRGMTKYTADKEGGDGLKTLEPEDDPVIANWGTKWRIPTVEEFEELNDETKCEWTWDATKKGYKVKGLKTGNSIFLPAAGSRNGMDLESAGAYGYYWLSSVQESFPDRAFTFYFSKGGHDLGIAFRCLGRPVRAVTEY